MKNKLQKPIKLLMAQAMIAVTFPVSAFALPMATPVNFDLPINEKITVKSDEAITTSTGWNQPSLSQAIKTEAAQEKLEGKVQTDDTTLSLEEALGDQVETIVEADQGPKVIVIDNDNYQNEPTNEYKFEEIKDAPGKTKISAGAKFPLTIISAINSKTAKVGDPIEARLKTDIKIGGNLVARKGDKVIGHISSCMKARRILHAELSKSRWMRANGCVGIQFDEIITANGEHLPLVAQPARVARVVKNKNEGRVLGVNHKGELASPLSTQLKHQAAHLAIRGAASVGGVFSMGAVPAAYGIVGAINPSFAFLHTVGKNVPHRRLKGFAMGVVSGLPGGFLIADTIIKGKEAVIKPGDTFVAEFQQEFTGEAATSAQMLPGASGKVHGEVMPEKKK